MEREIRIDWETSFLEKLIEKIEIVAEKKGYVKKIDIEPQADRRILEFQKGEDTFSISLDFYESQRSYFSLKGKEKAVDIFFEGIRLFIEDILKTLRMNLKSRKDKQKLKKVLESLKKFF